MILFLMLLLALPLGAQTITVEVDTTDAPQRSAYQTILSAQATERAAACSTTAAYVDSVAIDSMLTAIGVSVLPDAVDSQWVQVDVPLSGATGLTRAFWLGGLQEFIDDGAQTTATGRIRTQHHKAVRGLLRLRAVM